MHGKSRPFSKGMKKRHRKKFLHGTKIKDIINMVSSILVPIILGVFTILSTYNQWSIENNRTEQHAKLEEERFRKQSELESERYQQQIDMNLDKYRNDLLVDYIEKMGSLMKENNFSITHDMNLAALASAKSLSTLAQLDPKRVSRIIRFLYDTKLIENVPMRTALNIATANLSLLDKCVLKRSPDRGGLNLNGVFVGNTSFTNVLLDNMKFESTNFQNISFSSSTTDYDDQSTMDRRSTVMMDVNFSSASLNQVTFMAAKLEYTSFIRARLQDVSFFNGKLDHVEFSNASLSKVDFRKTKINKVSFDWTVLRSVSFDNLTLVGINFRHATLTEVDFSFTRLISIDFSGANFKQVNFTGAILYHVLFDDGATMKDVYYDDAVFFNVTFRRTKLEHVQFVFAAFCKYKYNNQSCRYIQEKIFDCIVSGSFIDTDLLAVNFSRALRTFVNFTRCSMFDIDFSYANLKQSRFQEDGISSLQRLNFFRANLQYASLDHRYFDNIIEFNTSYIHYSRTKGKLHRDPNLLLSSTNTCEKRISTDWKVEFGDEHGIYAFNKWTGLCRFALKPNITRATVTRNMSLSDIWDRSTWPVSYAGISTSMSVDVVVEILGTNENETIVNSIYIDSGDKSQRRMKLYKDMDHIVVKIHFTSHHSAINPSNIWCDEPYLIIEYGTKQDLHSSLHNIPSNPRWSTTGDVIIEGLSGRPFSLTIDQESGEVFVADTFNNRIVSWVSGEQGLRVIVKNLSGPTNVLHDKGTKSLIIADSDNRRVIRWPLQSHNARSETIISDIACWGLAMDDEGSLYVTDIEKDEVRRYIKANTIGELVAGGNGQGPGLHQLNGPFYAAVDSEGAVYVSDCHNHRIVKWNRGAKEGIIVAGFEGQGSKATQLDYPRSVLIDADDNHYIADEDNHRVIRYQKKAKVGDTLVDQLNYPAALAFDNQNNLYIADHKGRALRFKIIH